MGKYLGPKVKKLRKFNLNILPGFCTKLINKKLNIRSNSSAHISYYLTKLTEKQKLKFNYSLKESKIKQYLLAVTNNKFKYLSILHIIEKRLDATLVRIGFCSSILQARQFISHGFIFVNLKQIRVPSLLLTENDTVHLKSNSKSIVKKCKLNILNKNQFKQFYMNKKYNHTINYGYLVCLNSLKFKIIKQLIASEFLFKVNTQLIKDYYYIYL